MATPKNEAPKNEAPATKPEGEATLTDTAPVVAVTSVEEAAKQAKAVAEARANLLFETLADMDDADDSQWEPNRMPKLSYLSSVIGGEPVTMEEVGAVVDSPSEIQRRLVGKEQNDEDGSENDNGSQPVRVRPGVKAKPSPFADKSVLTPERVAGYRARQKELESAIVLRTSEVRESTAALQAAQKERDAIVAQLSTLDSNNHSETVKAYQASENRANQQRAADVTAFRKATGGINIGVAATNADVNRLQRRALRRRLGA